MFEQDVKSKSILDGIVKQPTRVVLYARKSTDDTKGDGLESQLLTCKKFAKENGYNIIDELSEDVRGVVGDDKNAPALNKALEMARAGSYDILIIRDVKRYSREIDKAIDFEKMFYRAGVKVYYVWDNGLNDLPMKGTGRLMRLIKYWEAEEDRYHTVKKLYLKRVEKVENKDYVMVHGNPPYGYTEKVVMNGRTVIHRSLETDKDEEKWVIKIFEWYVIDGLSLRKIVVKLKENCVPKPSVSGKMAITSKKDVIKKGSGPFDWSRTTVRSILTRRAYIGEWEYSKNSKAKQRIVRNSIIGEEIVKDSVTATVPHIVSKELFNAAQEKLTENKKKTAKDSQYQYLMRGNTECGLCGRACSCRTRKTGTKDYFRYFCNGRWDRAKDPETGEVCKLPLFNQDIVDFEVWNWLTNLMNNDTELEKGYQDYLTDKESEIEPLQEELQRIEEGIAEYTQRLVKQVQALTILEDMQSGEAVSVIKVEIASIEEVIARYKKRKEKIQAKLDKNFVSQDFINDFDDFVKVIRQMIIEAENDFDLRVRLINVLNVSVTLTVEDEIPLIYPQCVLKKATLPILYKGSYTFVQDGHSIILRSRIVYKP